MQPKASPHHPFRAAVQLGLAGLFVVGALNYQAILDQYALVTFRPGTGVAAIEARLALTPKARAVFYRAQPQLDAKAEFNQDCQTQPHELELGCYFRSRIYILKIDNQSLASEMDVVTAHGSASGWATSWSVFTSRWLMMSSNRGWQGMPQASQARRPTSSTRFWPR